MKIEKTILQQCGLPRPVGNGNRDFSIYKGYIDQNTWIGEPDATKEWANNKKLSTDRFVLTKSYEIFSSQNTLFLFGRRGTGKTSILQMLNHRTNKNLKSIYSYSTIIKKENHLKPLTMALRSYNDSIADDEMIHVAKSLFKWIINVCAMKRLLKNFKDVKGEDLDKIRTYLVDLKLIGEEEFHSSFSPIQTITDYLYANQESYVNDKLDFIGTLLKTIKQLESREYLSALNGLISVLNKEKKTCLVLIDSQERYKFNDRVFSNTITGLISAVLEIDQVFRQTKIKAKVAFPSEIVPHMNPENKGKTNTKSHFIFWQYNDIAELISKRYSLMLSDLGIEDARGHTDGQEGVHEIYNYIPKTINTYSKIEYDTLSYVINHTQKKPREVIQLFNKILSLGHQNKVPFTKITPEYIIEGTNAEIKDLSSAVLDMYREIYTDVYPIVNKTFTDRKNIMTFGDMQSFLRETKSLIIDYSGSRHQIERLFAESGILGKVTSISRIKDSDKKICQADFEYQIKGGLTFQSQDVLAIHPMFYQEFNSMVFEDTLVVPKPSPNEQNQIIEKAK
ncbi:hypothetical protein MTsPCn5_28840 [Croceitalea sp. MTPC5]|uniref:P-loop ATPase, Sll1717 family n=1 Tax=Croceitalea sp. MTPC5 TaxID=3056565 RepID=UPI002B3A0DC5|nr:hypothetical protein MTsPCn5_28840 [Croceitalea sp. MTPC5]